MKANLKYPGLTDLNENEMKQINGGIWPIIAAAIAIYGGLNALAYAIGYTVGTIEKELE